MTAEEFRRVTEVTYLGVVHGTLALKRKLPRDRGTIVQVGSARSYRSIPLQSAYCAAKHAERGFTDSLRCELIHGGSKVHVTMVQMPTLNTPQFGWTMRRKRRSSVTINGISTELSASGVWWRRPPLSRRCHSSSARLRPPREPWVTVGVNYGRNPPQLR